VENLEDPQSASIAFSDTTIPDMIRSLQKKIKYGLNSDAAIKFYELGFSDRVLTQDLADASGTEFAAKAIPAYVKASAENIGNSQLVQTLFGLRQQHCRMEWHPNDIMGDSWGYKRCVCCWSASRN